MAYEIDFAQDANPFRKWLTPDSVCMALILGTFLSYLSFVLLAHKPLTGDEPYYLDLVGDLEKYGFSIEFLRSFPGSAGPLHAFVHFFAKPLTNLDIPGVRLVNLVLLALTTFLLTLSAKTIGPSSNKTISLSWVCLPGMGVAACWALTEVPAMFFVALSLLCLLFAMKLEHPRWIEVFLACVGGICIGLAILGRQNYVVTLLALPLLWKKEKPFGGVILLIYLLVSLSITMPVFFLWKGFVPPQNAFMGKGGFSIEHGVLAFGYATAIILILAPKYLAIPGKWLVLGILSGFPIRAIAKSFDIVPFKTLISMILPQHLVHVYAFVCSSLLIGFSIICLVALSTYLNKKTDRTFLFLLVAAFLIIGSCAGITRFFASRYVVVSFPYMVLAFSHFRDTTYGLAARLCIGAIFSLLAAWTYS